MSDPDDPELTQLLTDLTRTLRELEEEAAPPGEGPRLPTPSELSRFTSEVAIPGLILVLRTNIRALQLLQRALRLADGRDPSPDGAVAEARTRAEAVGRASLSQLDGVLADLQSALEARPENDETRELVDHARSLREEIQDELDDAGTSLEDADDVEGTGAGIEDADDVVNIDIESELQSLKDNLDDADDGPGDDQDGEDGDGDDDTGSDGTGAGDEDDAGGR